jgi:hypothetical protein
LEKMSNNKKRSTRINPFPVLAEQKYCLKLQVSLIRYKYEKQSRSLYHFLQHFV